MNLDAVILDDVLAGIDEDEWMSGPYGMSVVHTECGTEIELDCERCPECGTLNPLFGFI